MAFLNEISKVFNLPIDEIFGEIYVVLGSGVVYIEGVKRFISVNSEQILMQMKIGKLALCGKNLEIMELSKNSASIRGVIVSVTRID